MIKIHFLKKDINNLIKVEVKKMVYVKEKVFLHIDTGRIKHDIVVILNYMQNTSILKERFYFFR